MALGANFFFATDLECFFLQPSGDDFLVVTFLATFLEAASFSSMNLLVLVYFTDTLQEPAPLPPVHIQDIIHLTARRKELRLILFQDPGLIFTCMQNQRHLVSKVSQSHLPLQGCEEPLLVDPGYESTLCWELGSKEQIYFPILLWPCQDCTCYLQGLSLMLEPGLQIM